MRSLAAKRALSQPKSGPAISQNRAPTASALAAKLVARWAGTALGSCGAAGAPIEFVHRKCGHVTQARVVCDGCGEDLGAHNVRPQLGPGGELAYVEAIEDAGGGKPVFLRPAVAA